MPDEKPKLTVRLFPGDGDWFTYVDVEIGSELMPELTFTGVFSASGFKWAEPKGPRTKIITTLPYIIETDVPETK